MSNIINTTKDGVLDGTTPDDMRTLVKNAVSSGKPLLIHIHGGLVSKAAATDAANRLSANEYGKGDVFPIFLVWETSIPETLRNLPEVLKKPLFEQLLFRLTKFLAGKVSDAVPGAKAAMGGGPEPSNAHVEAELQKRNVSATPFPELDGATGVSDMTALDKQRLTQELIADEPLQAAWQAEVDSASAAPAVTSASPIRLKQKLVDEAAQESATASKALVTTAQLVKAGILIAARVIKRYIQHRDHGFHATVVEELLRELYVDDIGAAVWGFMKQDAADTFADAGQKPERGGWFLLELLAQEFLAQQKAGTALPKVSVVGHSAGAIYACELLRYLHACRQDPAHLLTQSGFMLDKLVFLAPAGTCALFAEVLKGHSEKAFFNDFRMFALTDADESGYYEIPVLYPRSLLYIISGLLEGAGIVDQTLVGLDRDYRKNHPYTDAVVIEVRDFLAASQNRKILSGQNLGPGLACDSHKHGEFSSTPGTLGSVVTFVGH
jgi:hypothetical protein